MLPVARWCVRLPRQHVRALATRSTPPTPKGPRSRLIRVLPPQSSRPKSQQNASRPQNKQESSSSQPESRKENEPSSSNEPSKNEAVSKALATVPDAENELITPVHIPEDPHAILKDTHPAMRLLDNSTIVIQRQLEMMNVLMGFEQANKYIIMDPHGNHIGYLAEQDHGFGSAMARQMFRTHRSFTTHVFDREEKEVLRFHRPFAWVNSAIRVYDAAGTDGAYTTSDALQGTSTKSVINQTSAGISSIPVTDMRIIGSAEQEWGLLRRKYNLHLARNIDDTPAAPGTPQLASGDLPLSNSKALAVIEGDSRQIGMMQFARVDEPFLSWDFSLKSEDGRLIGSVNRNFSGFAREIFTDTGVYALRMDSANPTVESSQPQEPVTGMTLDQRAVMLATAVSIDFDYFSRHSNGVGGGMWPMWMIPWGGGGAAAEGVAAGEAGAVGAAAGEAGAVGRGLGAGEGAMAGAGTMAGYEAMQRGRESTQQNEAQGADSQSLQGYDPYQSPAEQQQPGQGGEDVWGQTKDPWAQNDDNDLWGNNQGGDSGGGGRDGGGGDGGDWGDWF